MKINTLLLIGTLVLGSLGAALWYWQHTHQAGMPPAQEIIHRQDKQISPETPQPSARAPELANSTGTPSLPTSKKSRTIPAISSPRVIKKDPLYWDWSTIDTAQIYFPEDFLWGTASAAQTVEGNCTNNDWCQWERTHADARAGASCDQWNRYKQDIQLMKKCGLNAYRFSVEWSKIEPEQGIFDQKALAHYEDICKELLANGIQPMITLYHNTNPSWFTALGGFEKERNIGLFIEYSKMVFKRLAPYAHLWLTFNAPTSYVARAYHAGLHPPGIENMQLMEEVLKNMLEAHVRTYQALKKIAPSSAIGIGHNIYQVEPKNFWDIPGCTTAHSLFHDNFYRFFRTGDFKASVPFKVNIKHYNEAAPTSLDFIGLSYYSHGSMSGFEVDAYPGDQKTQIKIYTVYPEGLYRALHELTKELAQPLDIPIYITENGIATLHEEQRELFFKRYLFALSYAIKTGCPVKGYFVWSLTDTYEWGSFDYQFGLFGINFETLERDKEPRAGAQYFIDMVKQFG